MNRLVLILLCVLFMIANNVYANPSIYEWTLSKRHSFCQNFPAGNESDGRKLFITQIERHNKIFGVKLTFDGDGNLIDGPSAIYKNDGSSWHIGKAGTHLKNGATYSYGGKEKDVGSFSFPSGNKYPHYTFCLTGEGQKLQSQGKIKWVSASNGSVPNGAIKGFNRRENHHVCRASWAGGKHPGKLIPGQGCFIGYGGGEKGLKGYEVLVITK